MSLLEGCQNLPEIESRLQPQLACVTLLGQIPLSEPDAELLRRTLRRAIAHDFSEVRHCGPLACSRFLVWVGARHYEQGTYWQMVEQYLGQAGTHWQHFWGELFLDTLRRYRLTVWRNQTGLRFVTPILLHGGIPDSDLPNFFEHVLYPLVDGRLETELGDAEQLVAEWRELSLYRRTNKPVQRFLVDGGKPAADFLSRCLELAQAAYAREPLPSAGELRLPENVVQQFEQWWRAFAQPLLFEQRSRLRRPRLERDAYGELRCVLPEQIIVNSGDAFLQLQVSAAGRDVGSIAVPFYQTARGLVTERAECLLPPAANYQVQLLKDARPLGDWSCVGLQAEKWLACDERGALIRGSQLPRDCFWLIFSDELELDAAAHVIEEAPSAWEGFHHWLIDATDAQSLALVKPNGERVELPLAGSRAAALSGATLSGCDAAGQPVYVGELPTLRVPLAEAGELDRWDVIVEDLTERVPTRKRLALSEATAELEQGYALAPLAQAALLGEPLLGNYRVKLRAHGALGSDQQFYFAFVRDLNCAFAQPFYLANEAPRLLINAACRVTAEDAAVEIKPRGAVIEVTTPTPYRLLTLRLQEHAGREVDLTFALPRLRWTLTGLHNHLSPGWLAEPLNAQREDFEASSEVTLIVQAPLADGAPCVVELEGALQRSSAQVRRGEVRIPLSPFRDSLAQLSAPVARFVFSFTDAAGKAQRLYPLAIRTRWLVEKFECRDTRIVTFSWPEQEAATQCERRDVTFCFTDQGRYCNRRLRLWNLFQPWRQPCEISVPDGSARVEITEPLAALPAGRYRVELFTEGEFAAPAPLLPPRRNDVDVFDLTLGEGELLRELLAPANSFRAQLSRRLAGHDGNFASGDAALTPGELDDLTRALIFLNGEGRASEIKQLWFDELAQQIKQPPVRKAVRERLQAFAAHETDENQALLRELCALIGLAVRAFIPFAVGTQVRFENIAAVFQGVEEWEGQTTRLPQVVDLLRVEHPDPRSRSFFPVSRLIPLTKLPSLLPLND